MTPTIFGIERILSEQNLLKDLEKKRVAIVVHPASVTFDLDHSLDALIKFKGINITSCFGPQHGVKGEKQYNMIESEDFIHPVYKIPVYSLYGKVRRPTEEMINSFDLVLFDLQDLGTRVYTFLTTLRYMMEACAKYGKIIWILDRPNPAGREIDGMNLVPEFESFVGSAAFPIRHGFTLGEAAHYFVKTLKLDLDYKVIEMKNYYPENGLLFGWPADRTWVNPSTNSPTLNMARCYPGTVLIEGTTLSEGRGTTRSLELVGANDIDTREILQWMQKNLNGISFGCRLREIYFEPTFYKHANTVCHGIQIHTDGHWYNPKEFKPYRLIALFLKALRALYPKYAIWRNFKYEYETDKLAIDLINGNTFLREWVDDPNSSISEFWKKLDGISRKWMEERKEFLIY